MLYSQASEVRGLPGPVLYAQRMAGCSAEATGFSGDEKYIPVVKRATRRRRSPQEQSVLLVRSGQ